MLVGYSFPVFYCGMEIPYPLNSVSNNSSLSLYSCGSQTKLSDINIATHLHYTLRVDTRYFAPKKMRICVVFQLKSIVYVEFGVE